MADVDNENQVREDTDRDVSHTTGPRDKPEEGRRMIQLRKALEKTVDKCVSCGKFSLFARHFPRLFKTKPKALEEIHSQYQKHLRQSIMEEIETMFSEEMICELLNELDQLEHSSEDHGEAWRPSGIPEADVRAHICAVKLKHRQKLQSVVTEIQQENKRLEEAVRNRRNHLKKSVQKAESRVDSFSQIASDLQVDE